MTIKKYHLQEQNIPDGFQIFESTLDVMGVQYQKESAIAFAKNLEGSWLEFEKDENNELDNNAIKIIGCNGTNRYFIGYAPKETSRLISEGGFWGQVIPRLYKTYVSNNGFVEILFQILGPIGKKYEYLQTEKVQGKHFTDYVDRVKQLMQDKNYPEAIELLLRLVDETESEAKNAGKGYDVAPWYYEQLAVIYRKEKRYQDEIEILERFEKQSKSQRVTSKKMTDRLDKAKGITNKKEINASVNTSVKERLVGLLSSYEEPYPLQIVGESSYRNNIEKICGYFDEEEGYNDDSHVAALYLEDDNPYDPNNAVCVAIDDLTVGYLSKTNATSYRKRLTLLNAPINAIGICSGSIRGGHLKRSGEVADFGVRLDIDINNFTLTRVRYENEWIYPFGVTSPEETAIKPSVDKPVSANLLKAEQVEQSFIPFTPSKLVSKPKVAPKRKYKFPFIPMKGSGALYYLVVFPIVFIINAYIFIFVGLWFGIVALWDVINNSRTSA